MKKNKPSSHHQIGWQDFTKTIFQTLQIKQHIVYILWGQFVNRYAQYICKTENHIIKSPHPSPFYAHRVFFGSKLFLCTNTYLQSHRIQIIYWNF
jgi:uracil-DNA glycosylase